tara:strand:- start:2687 stop:2914 length:228 start_codon:yes stop_codon:yes gene_type:complete
MFWFSKYFYESQLIKMIDDIEEKRKNLRLEGETMKLTFAQELKNLISGIKLDDITEEDEDEDIKKQRTRSKSPPS